MEFHDILHGHIRFAPGEPLTSLLQELINSPEINRLRNMRQMNFDVPLIQELGRSRRLPHSIGVAHISSRLARVNALSLEESKVLIAASLLHDAAIPPYGHLVESEFKSVDPGFKHERRVKELINGTINTENKYTNIVPGRSLQVSNILNRYEIDHKQVFDVICPTGAGGTPLVADIDIDNIDNVHRMAAMLGWPGAKENTNALIAEVSLRGLGRMAFSKTSLSHLRRWLDFRQKIYTMIIAHPECIPYNMLQTDLVRIAVSNGIISPEDWYLSEPEFEEALRSNTSSKMLAQQLISGCEYQLVDYVWVKNFDVTCKLSNKMISEHLSETTGYSSDYCYFIWNENGLICRKVQVNGANWDGQELGESSTSCMIALVKRTPGKPKWTKAQANKWRRDVLDQSVKLFEENHFDVDFPETYTGSFFGSGNGEISVEYQ